MGRARGGGGKGGDEERRRRRERQRGEENMKRGRGSEMRGCSREGEGVSAIGGVKGIDGEAREEGVCDTQRRHFPSNKLAVIA